MSLGNASWSLYAFAWLLSAVPACRSVPPTPQPLAVCPKPVEPAPTAVATAPPEPKAILCGLPLDLKRPEWPTTLPSTRPEELAPAPEGTVSLVLLPDTQYYASCRYPHLKNQSNFIAQARDARHLLAAISLGDLTDHNTNGQWEFVRESVSSLPKDFPLLLSTGNHDTGSNGTADSRDSQLSTYFPESWAAASGALREVMTPGRIENAFYSLDAGTFRLGVLMLEWSPRRNTVSWANQIVAKYRDHRIVVSTHAYLYEDSTRYDYVTRKDDQLWNPLAYRTAKNEFAEDGSCDGEMLWNELIRKHPNIFLVVSGHVLGQGAARLTSVGDSGNVVHQLLANYQMLDEGGLGYLRLLEFYPDHKTLHVKTYSPSLNVYSYAADQDFRLELSPPLDAPLPKAPRDRGNAKTSK